MGLFFAVIKNPENYCGVSSTRSCSEELNMGFGLVILLVNFKGREYLIWIGCGLSRGSLVTGYFKIFIQELWEMEGSKWWRSSNHSWKLWEGKSEQFCGFRSVFVFIWRQAFVMWIYIHVYQEKMIATRWQRLGLFFLDGDPGC